MLPDRVSNPGPLTYESGALPIALRGPAKSIVHGTRSIAKKKKKKKKSIVHGTRSIAKKSLLCT